MLSFNSQSETELVVPPAASMSESLRGVGYTLRTAIADLIDNSISAEAKNVWITFLWDGVDSFISVLDDGIGLSGQELSQAMRPGSKNPQQERNKSDLGRFGLGLKTASLSQCRSFTVASKLNGEMSIRRWDQDHIVDTDKWEIYLTARAGFQDRLHQLDRLDAGTLVLWEKLEETKGKGPLSQQKMQDIFLQQADSVKEHLAMVFHRFLEGSSPDLKIYISGDPNNFGEQHRVQPWDPFMTNHPATIKTPEERIVTISGTIKFRGFILPHKDKLDKHQYDIAAGPNGWTSQQGFYIYRGRRMLVSGGWLGMGNERLWTKEEPYKLARIKIDIPNTADKEWDIDIKKSTARPPAYVRTRLRDLAGRLRQQARQIFAYRGGYGSRSPSQGVDRAWLALEKGDSVTYRINRQHPAVERILQLSDINRDDIETMLKVIELTVPVQKIWLDTVEKGDIQGSATTNASPDEIKNILEPMYEYFVKKVNIPPFEAKERLLKMEIFRNFPEIIEKLDIV